MTSKSEVPGEDIPFSEQLDDERLLNAVTIAVNSQTMTPLIKEELRCTILSRRHAEGKGEIKLEEKKSIPKKVYTELEKQRKLRRQEQNRRAAQRCREKKKEQENAVLKDYYEQKAIGDKLNKDINSLVKEREQLKKLLCSHLKTCTLPGHSECPENEHIDTQTTLNLQCTSNVGGTSSYNCQIEISPPTDEDPFYNVATSDMSDNFPDYDDFTSIGFPDHNDNVALDNSPVFFEKLSSGDVSNMMLDNSSSVFSKQSASNSQLRRRHVSESSYFSDASTDIIDEPIYSDVHNIPTRWDVIKQDGFHSCQPEATKHDNIQRREQLGHESLTSEYDCNKYDRLLNTEFSPQSFLPLLAESEMDMRQNGEERGASCSSLEELDITASDIMQFLNHDIANGNALGQSDDPDQSVFAES